MCQYCCLHWTLGIEINFKKRSQRRLSFRRALDTKEKLGLKCNETEEWSRLTPHKPIAARWLLRLKSGKRLKKTRLLTQKCPTLHIWRELWLATDCGAHVTIMLVARVQWKYVFGSQSFSKRLGHSTPGQSWSCQLPNTWHFKVHAVSRRTLLIGVHFSTATHHLDQSERFPGRPAARTQFFAVGEHQMLRGSLVLSIDAIRLNNQT